MARSNRLADVASSLLSGVATLMLLTGLLLAPNVVVADDPILDPGGGAGPGQQVAPCNGCNTDTRVSTCKAATTNCFLAALKCVPSAPAGCQDGTGNVCGCGDQSSTTGACDCEA